MEVVEGELIQFLAFGRIDDADAFEGDVQVRCHLFDPGAFAQENGRAEPQGLKLSGRLQDVGFGAFRKTTRFGWRWSFSIIVPMKRMAESLPAWARSATTMAGLKFGRVTYAQRLVCAGVVPRSLPNT